MKTTLNQIRACGPCKSGWETLLRHLGKTKPDEEPLPLRTILESNGLNDALWCLRAVPGYDKEKRLLAVTYAEEWQFGDPDPLSLKWINLAKSYCEGGIRPGEFNKDSFVSVDPQLLTGPLAQYSSAYSTLNLNSSQAVWGSAYPSVSSPLIWTRENALSSILYREPLPLLVESFKKSLDSLCLIIEAKEALKLKDHSV